ncbi:hypothetical protein NQD34_018474 [Periophthalmus magnuspinnatus]|nr:hypothetical protein NQD34_018474 [Periophthalmus magnuspinnatus]
MKVTSAPEPLQIGHIVVYTKRKGKKTKKQNIQCYLHFRCYKVFAAPSVFFSAETGSKMSLWGLKVTTPDLNKAVSSLWNQTCAGRFRKQPRKVTHCTFNHVVV